MNGPVEICLIAAMSRNRVIGVDGDLPWHMPADMQFFKRTTLGHPIIMGRKTFETFPKLLPDRRHIVITRQNGYDGRGADVADSLERALSLAGNKGCVFVIGGQQIYELAMPHAHRVQLTRIETDIENGDAFFPKLDEQTWTLKDRQPHAADEKNPFDYAFETYMRTG